MSSSRPSQWVRPSPGNPEPTWGFRDGLRVAIHPASVEGTGDGGPRGLLRIGYPILGNGIHCGLVNYIAMEPVVARTRGFSELEPDPSDHQPGLRIWPGHGSTADPGALAGELHGSGPSQRLRVKLAVQQFSNGARCGLVMEFRRDAPGEVRLEPVALPGSSPMEQCILTATMGNYGRLRRLHLRTRVATPLSLWPGFRGPEFSAHAFVDRTEMPEWRGGGPIAICTTDEASPGAVPVEPWWWRYRGDFPVTQYWRVPRAEAGGPIQVCLNARADYWANHTPIPGGPAFENFEIVRPFVPGETVIFGLTREGPGRLAKPAPALL